MNAKWFEDSKGNKVLVSIKRSCIELYGKSKTFQCEKTRIVEFLINGAKKNWKSFKPREAYSFESDYTAGAYFTEDGNDWEIGLGFDKNKDFILSFFNPDSMDLHYRFSRKQAESFAYDLEGGFEKQLLEMGYSI
ncbi:MAG: hypothetical protein ABF991_11485 [Liquorilactobacillus hordei]|uniref:hypothetical protein n=1 Tax=Liquorilactobacillus hordei TaxID=468911 RepID=UPI0039EA2168